MSDFGGILVFLGSLLCHQKEEKKSRPTDHTWKVRPPVKQGFFFFVAFV